METRHTPNPGSAPPAAAPSLSACMTATQVVHACDACSGATLMLTSLLLDMSAPRHMALNAPAPPRPAAPIAPDDVHDDRAALPGRPSRARSSSSSSCSSEREQENISWGTIPVRGDARLISADVDAQGLPMFADRGWTASAGNACIPDSAAHDMQRLNSDDHRKITVEEAAEILDRSWPSPVRSERENPERRRENPESDFCGDSNSQRHESRKDSFQRRHSQASEKRNDVSGGHRPDRVRSSEAETATRASTSSSEKVRKHQAKQAENKTKYEEKTGSQASEQGASRECSIEKRKSSSGKEGAVTSMPPHAALESPEEEFGRAISAKRSQFRAASSTISERYRGSMMSVLGFSSFKADVAETRPSSFGATESGQWSATAAGPTPKASYWDGLFVRIKSSGSGKNSGKHFDDGADKTAAEVVKESAKSSLRAVFDKVATLLDSLKDDSLMADWENLFISISGSRSNPINVSADLGETLIRLGINIDIQNLQETIHSVCSSRGREPDAWHGTGLSAKTAVYHELSCDEFIAVMQILTKKKDDKLMQARQIFAKFDGNRSGSFSAEAFRETVEYMGIRSTEDEQDYEELFQQVVQGMIGSNQSSDHDKDRSHLERKVLDFEQFLEIMGLEGSNEDYLEMEMDDLRKRLLEALKTFHTFDEDGGGSIDSSEIKTTMRAMGHKISDAELERMIELADPDDTGEIDFENFCYVVLNVTRTDFAKMIEAHIQKPILLDESSEVMAVRRKTLEQLCPEAFRRAFAGEIVIEKTSKEKRKEKRKDSELNFIPQDLGQYGPLARQHPLLDENSDHFKPDFVKRAISRPMAMTVHKHNGVVTCAAMCPTGLRLALTTSDGYLRLYDLRKPKAKQIYYTVAHDHMALCLVWLPDGSGLVSGGADWTVKMWAGEDLSFLGSEIRHLGYVRCLATSYDSKWAASGSSDLSIKIFSFLPFKFEDISLEGHTSWVRWLHFSHDNNRLISGGDDQSIIIWSMVTHTQMQTLRAHSHTVAAGVSLSSNKLWTGGFDENLLVWSQDTGLLGYLKVFVAEAFDLPRGDLLAGTMSNQRFAKIELGKAQQFETKFKSGRSPQWFEEFDLDVWNVDERVCIEVYDWDKDEQHRFLGSLHVPLEELLYADEGITDREYDLLDEEGNQSKSAISVRFTFRQVRCTGELTVDVQEAKNLPRMDTFGLADPFVALTCGKGVRHKTQVKKNNLNPKWNETFVFNVEDSARELKIVLYDWSFTKEEEFIGQVQIATASIEENPDRNEWFKLKDLEGNDVKGEVKLTIRFITEKERDTTAIRFRRNPASWPVGEKSDFNHYAPVGQIKFLGRTILRGKCKHCNLPRSHHAKNLRCDLGTGNYFHSLAINTNQTLIACGTGDGRIRISYLATGQQIACWTAHAGPVHGLQFANGDDRLLSWGADSRSVSLKDYTHGSYLPMDPSDLHKGKRNCVEVWYVASMMAALHHFRHKNMATDLDSPVSDQSPKSPIDEEGSDDDFAGLSLDDHESEDENMSAEERAHRQAMREKRLAKEALSMKRRKGKGGQHGAMPGARVGYTAVYYPAPVLSDGTSARSCLKGRGRQEPMRASLVWGETERENLETFFYPPEYPQSDESDDDEGETIKANNKKKSRITASEARQNSAEKKQRSLAIQKQRALERQARKDAELFGLPTPDSLSKRTQNSTSQDLLTEKQGADTMSAPKCQDSTAEVTHSNDTSQTLVVSVTQSDEEANTVQDKRSPKKKKKKVVRAETGADDPSALQTQKIRAEKSGKAQTGEGSPKRKTKKSPKKPDDE